MGQKRAVEETEAMLWRAYQVVFRLRAPLHIGAGKVGNVQRTRPYVTGRVLWGALTMRLTRDAANGRGPATDSRDYQRVGATVHQSLAFTYFYAATKAGSAYEIPWPWQDESYFRRRFLSSYSGTALSYPHQAAAAGMLHEVEFLSPHTLDTGEPVFLVGHIFERTGNTLAWQAACTRLQLGGERGYGWGGVDLVEAHPSADSRLFDGQAVLQGGDEAPLIHLPASEPAPGRVLAHTLAPALLATGEVEPLIGREWQSYHPRHRYAGQHVTFSAVCFTPGSTVRQARDFAVAEFGVWRWVEAS
jgi:hypothetical protein